MTESTTRSKHGIKGSTDAVDKLQAAIEAEYVDEGDDE